MTSTARQGSTSSPTAGTSRSSLSRLDEWIIRTHVASVLIFVFTSPWIIYGFSAQIGFTLRFSRITFALAVVATAMRAWRVRDLRVQWNKIDWLLVAYLATGLVSGLLSGKKGDFYVRYFGLIECVTIFYLMRLYLLSITNIRKTITCYALSLIPVLIAGFHQLWTVYHGTYKGPLFLRFFLVEKYERLMDPLVWKIYYTKWTRLSSTLGEPNMAGGALAASLPLLLYQVLVYGKRGKFKTMLATSSLLVAVCMSIIATGSKSALLSCVTGVAIFLIGARRTEATSRFKRLTFGISALVATSMAIYAYFSWDMLLERAAALDNGHLKHRILSFKVFMDHPLTGVGFGNFGTTHTLVLTALVETGIVGGTLLLGLFLAPILEWLKLKPQTALNDPSECLMAWAALGAFMSIVVGLNLYDYLLYPFVWILFALIVSFNERARALSTSTR